MSFLGDVGEGAGYAGALLQAVGTYYGVRSQQLSMRSQAMGYEFDQSIASLNARQAEREAEAIRAAGRQQNALMTMQRGQQKSSFRASTGASGFGQGGSAAEVRASMEYAKQLDTFGINLNTIAAANRASAQAVDFRNRAAMSGVSARNLRATGNTLSPWGSTITSLLGSGSTLSNYWTQQRRREG